jgi:Cu2+-exporting ATPase
MTDPARHGADEHDHTEVAHAAGEVPDARGHERDDGHDTDAHAGQRGHDRHAGHTPEMFRDRFWLCLVLTIPVVFWSEHIQDLLNYNAPEFAGSDLIPPLLGTVIFLYGGSPFLRSARHELLARLPGMMVLISLAITTAFVFSWIVELGVIDSEPLWWELSTLVTIMLLGHWIEMRSINQAQGALQALAKLLPDMATRITNAGEESVPVGELSRGDIVLVRPGESVPVDGLVRAGRSDVNESLITGESQPVKKAEGDEVIAGTINGQGSLRVEVTGTGDETTLSRIMRLVSEAQESRSRAQQLADRAAQLLTFTAIGAAAITVVLWQVLDADIDFTIVRAVTVLVIACPHALGLAVPLVVAISTTLGAQGGLLVRDRRGLEEAREIDVVVFDKTGTLTLGEHRVVAMATADRLSEEQALQIAASVESDSEHPIARGITKTAEQKGIRVPLPQDFRATPGKGVVATVDGGEYQVGGPALLEVESTEVPVSLQRAAEAAGERGQAAIYLLKESEVQAVFAVADAVREESREAIAELHKRGIEVAMLTGDSWPVARAVANELQIDTVFAEVLPEDKASKIRELQAQGKRVAMVGDGVNDAPALATADVGIAIGAGTDVAVEAGDVVLVRSDPRDVPRIVTLSKATYRKMLQNLWWAAGYNIFAIPLAAGALARWDILLTPAVGAALMSASTVIVAINAQLLRRTRL